MANNFLLIRFAVFLPARLARFILPPGVQLAIGGVQLEHHHEGQVRRELRLALRDGGGGEGREVLEVHDHLQEAPQCPPVQRE